MAKAKKLPSGSWRVLLYVGTDAAGKRKYESFTAETKKEAEFMAAQFKMGIDCEKSSSITFLRAAEKFIADHENVLSPWTVDTYQHTIYRDLYDLHHVACANISSDVAQRFFNVFSINHSPKTVSNVHSVFTSVLRYHNPDIQFHISLPSIPKSDLSIPSDDQILAALHASNGYMTLIIQVAASLGLRRSEIAALTWNDIGVNSITVNKAMAKNNKKEWFIKSPKTYAGTRTLSIPPSLLSALLASRPAAASSSDQVFPVNPDYITRHWRLICKKCGFSFRFHSLRHYNASVMLSLGEPDKYAMARIGHATPKTLKIVYQHLIDERERQVSAQVDAYMSKFSEMQHEMQHDSQKAQ